MTKVVDKRAFAAELDKVSRYASESLSQRDLTLCAVDQKRAERVVEESRIYHSQSTVQDWGRYQDIFVLRYEGKPTTLNYIGRDGKADAHTIDGKTRDIAEFYVRSSRYFPTEMLDRLLRMQGEDRPQQEIFQAFNGTYESLGLAGKPGFKRDGMPFYVTIAEDTPQASIRGLTDRNIFMIHIGGEDYLRGMGATKILFGAAVNYYMDAGSFDEVPYGVAYARMAGLFNTLKKNVVASAEEAFDYFEKVKADGWSDWSMKFHVNAGARLLCALPNIASDWQSCDAGALAVYTPEALAKLREFFLETKAGKKGIREEKSK